MGPNHSRSALGNAQSSSAELAPVIGETSGIEIQRDESCPIAMVRQVERQQAPEAQVRPFGFLLEFTIRKGLFAKWKEEVVCGSERGRPKREDVRPIAPYDTDQNRAIANVFDRVTGQSVDSELLKTYAECLADYHLSPESKFENGNYNDRGRTERRHVISIGVVLIGKEANQVGESGEADLVVSAVQEFERQ